MTKRKEAGKGRPGPDPEVLKVEGEWQDAITKAVRRPKPPGGWPDRPAKPRKKRGRKKD